MIDLRYTCYERFGGKKDVEYCRLTQGMGTKEEFFNCVGKNQEIATD